MLGRIAYAASALLLLQTVDHPVDPTAKDVIPPKLVTQTDPELPELKRKEHCGHIKVSFVVDGMACRCACMSISPAVPNVTLL